MTAEFALSLSFDGIDLLHRAPGGWRGLGRVDIASPTLDADLAALRDEAVSVSAGSFATKLVIPQDQIKFLSLDAPDATAADVHTALEGATPYSLFDLVVDHVSENGKTHIAAVARETLEEAESFADGHGFRPVAFVAIPPDGTFPQEVFFGPTSVMPDLLGEDAQIARTDPPVVTGTNLKIRQSPKRASKQALFDTVIAEVPPTTASKPEDSPQPIKAETGSPTTVAAALTFFKPALFDAVIPETHSKSGSRAPVAPKVSPAVAKAVAAVGPSLAAPKRATPAAQNTRDGALTPGRIAAGFALLGAIGAGLWAYTNQAAVPPLAESPTEIVEADIPSDPVDPVAAPQVAEVTPDPAPQFVTGTTALPSAPQPSVLPQVSGVTLPAASRGTPVPVVMAAPDGLPTPPQAPPAPPAEVVATAETPADSTVAPTIGRVPTPDEARAFYEATGVWQRAPRFFDEPSGAIALGFVRPETTESYVADRGAPVPLPAEVAEVVFPAPVNPPPPDVTFARDADGFVLATPEGAVTPEGAIVFSGLPDIAFQPRPELSADDLARMALLAPAPDGVVIIAGPPPFATPLRPEGLQPELSEDIATPGLETPPATGPGSVGIAGLELQDSGSVALDTIVVERAAEDDPRPQLRPTGLAPVTAASAPDLTDILEGVVASDATLRFDNSTALAVASSLRPETRPAGFGDQIASLRAQRTAERLAAAAAAQAAPTPAPAAAPSVPQNSEPVPGGVARAATIEDAIRLRDINLIGVYGRPNDRRALVRLSNGRFVRVEVGSELDGGQVVAISDDALNYVKRGRTYAIGLPDT